MGSAWEAASDQGRLGAACVEARFGALNARELTLPAALSSALEEAKRALHADPRHELILPLRKKIWRAMGVRIMTGRNRAAPTPGLRRRTMLALYAVTFVLPLSQTSSAATHP
ncbi:MAG TPA: Imm5 family immunity protein, partial [Stellaceae bacterium]|nr:Imm5 family immunity protein [Stellaceae bacterium]